LNGSEFWRKDTTFARIVGVATFYVLENGNWSRVGVGAYIFVAFTNSTLPVGRQVFFNYEEILAFPPMSFFGIPA
jgi:hypothetical protein